MANRFVPSLSIANANCNGVNILIGLKITYDQVLDIQRETEISQLAQKHF
jgi:hypothetical protein